MGSIINVNCARLIQWMNTLRHNKNVYRGYTWELLSIDKVIRFGKEFNMYRFLFHNHDAKLYQYHTKQMGVTIKHQTPNPNDIARAIIDFDESFDE